MDISDTIRQLRIQKEGIERAIALLEEFLGTASSIPKPRRGRKSMPLEERQLVSERMKRYWEARRKKPD